MSETENVSFKTYDARGNGDGETTCTLTGNHQSFVSDYTALAVAYRKQGHPMNAEQGQGWEETEKNDTLNCHDNGESRTPTLINVPMCIEPINAVVRRLTPLECERLQGYPDGWTDIGEWTDSKGKKHKEADSPRYKALGNSIALPYWIELAKKVAESLGKENLTMGSLFDGIGGFPLAFSMAGVKPIWASEIEEFPIAVTKRRFPDAEEEQLRSEQDTDEN